MDAMTGLVPIHGAIQAGMDGLPQGQRREQSAQRGPSPAASRMGGAVRGASPRRAPGPFAGLFKVDEP